MNLNIVMMTTEEFKRLQLQNLNVGLSHDEYHRYKDELLKRTRNLKRTIKNIPRKYK